MKTEPEGENLEGNFSITHVLFYSDSGLIWRVPNRECKMYIEGCPLYSFLLHYCDGSKHEIELITKVDRSVVTEAVKVSCHWPSSGHAPRKQQKATLFRVLWLNLMQQ